MARGCRDFGTHELMARKGQYADDEIRRPRTMGIGPAGPRRMDAARRQVRRDE
jgi:hypothetical protein